MSELMKGVFLSALTAYICFLFWLWVRDLRTGEINRFPWGRVYKDKKPSWFKFWTVVHGAGWCLGFGLLGLAWWALFTGNLH